LKEKSFRDLELVINVSRRMSFLLNDLLDMARIKENMIDIQLKDNISLHSVTEGVIEILKYITEGKTIQLLNQIPANFPQVYADENRLNQILFNLLYNAVKYSNASEVSVYGVIQDEWIRVSVE